MGEDVEALFVDIQKVGAIENPLAREYGTTVWMCRQPRADMDAFWSARVLEVRVDK